MKKHLIFALLTSTSLVMAKQEPIYSVSSSQYYKSNPKEATHKTSAEKPVAAKAAKTSGQSEIMIISPEARATDLLNAFQYLRKVSASTKMGVKLTDGTVLTGILDMEIMPAGTLIIFKINTIKGQQYRVEKIENIDSLTNV